MAKHERERADVVNQQWHLLNKAYEEYAKSIGMTYTSLNILCVIFHTENCTQKKICERIYLPKQTVNNIITSFDKQNLIEMVELPEDRRTKAIHLTKEGMKLANKVLPIINIAEENAMAQFSEEEAEMFITLLKKYVTNCEKNMPISL